MQGIAEGLSSELLAVGGGAERVNMVSLCPGIVTTGAENSSPLFLNTIHFPHMCPESVLTNGQMI